MSPEKNGAWGLKVPSRQERYQRPTPTKQYTRTQRGASSLIDLSWTSGVIEKRLPNKCFRGSWLPHTSGGGTAAMPAFCDARPFFSARQFEARRQHICA